LYLYASPSIYSALKIRGCEAAVKRPEYSETTWSFRDAMYTNFVYVGMLSRGEMGKGRKEGTHTMFQNIT
jgi:hypothetical protein